MPYFETIKAIQRLVQDRVVPGVSYAFIDGPQVQTGRLGYGAWVPGLQAIPRDAIYDVASLTKVVGTLTVILQLLDTGRLSLEEPIRTVLPDWHDSRITIRHLLTHTSGIEGYIDHRDQLTGPALKAALLGLSVGPNFNQKMVYADVNYLFLGWIASNLLGAPIQQLIQQRVLRPLGMTDSSFAPPVDRCVPTEMTAKYGLLRGIPHDPKARQLGTACGSAGLFASLADLVTFCQAYLNPERTSVLPAKYLQSLAHDWTQPGNLGRSLGWALATPLAQADHQCLWQTGFTGTLLVLDPRRQQAMIFLSNRVHPHGPNTPFLARRNAIMGTYLSEKNSPRH